MSEPLQPVRRIVTGFDGDAASVVVSDTLVAKVAAPGGAAHPTEFSPIWGTEDHAAPVPSATDGADLLNTGIVNPRGSTFRIVDTAPHSSSPRHRTLSLDYIICLSGDLEMELDGGKIVKLRAGDVIVQQGAVHQWHNRSAHWVRFAAIMIGANIEGGPDSEDFLFR